MHKLTFNAAVIGAGPAGIASIGVLLDKLGADARILWFDPEFAAGRLSLYPQVPSNTRVCLFSKFARAFQSFHPETNRVLNEMERECDPQKGCKLDWPRRLCLQLTETLCRDPRVQAIRGKVISCERQPNSQWQVKANRQSGNASTDSPSGAKVFLAEKVILATGSHPRSLDLPNRIDLEDALDPGKLAVALKDVSCVAVWGSSHSAMLVLMNLIRDHPQVRTVYNFYRSSLVFASIPDPIGAPDCILNDNTGLKGEVADWVRSWCGEAKWDGQVGSVEEFLSGRLIRICVNDRTGGKDTTVARFPLVQANIAAVGYVRNPLPRLPEQVDPSQYTENGQIGDGLFGFGIAFPEKLEGGDLAVGMWKFMKYIQRCLG